MRGYISFLLVLLASLVLLNLLELYGSSSDIDLSDAVAAERMYGLEMNVKEAIIASVRLGSVDGFSEYDTDHDVKKCMHCPDNFCAPPTPADPFPPNICDKLLCDQCFRESEARNSAKDGAQMRFEALGGHQFDPDFILSFHPMEIEILLKPDPLSKNGYLLDFARFRKNCEFEISSEKFPLERKSKIPGGYVIESPGVD